MEQREKAPAYAAILAAAALWGAIGLWNRNLMAAGLSPASIVVVRNLGGMALLTLVFLFRDRSVFQVERGHLRYFFGTGVISVVLFTVCYFSCQRLCSLAAASILLYTAPAIVVLLSALLWREPVTARKIAALGLTLAGCALVCGVFSGGLTVTPAGILLGLGSGFFYALYSVFGRFCLPGPPLWRWRGPGSWRRPSPRGRRGCWPWVWWSFPPWPPTSCIPGAWPGWSPAGPPFWPAWSRWWPR